MKFQSTPVSHAAILAAAVLAPACAGSDGSLAPSEVETAVDAAVDYLESEMGDAEAAAEYAAPALSGRPALRVAPGIGAVALDEGATGVGTLRSRIRDAVVAAAEGEPCPVRGILVGIWDHDASGVGGSFEGLGVQRDGDLVGSLAGGWAPHEGAEGGGFDGSWISVMEGSGGSLFGEYGPAGDTDLGPYSGQWTFDDAPEGEIAGNLGGVWHAWGERGFLVGYYSRCDDAPTEG
ncbi:hypothetical protein L6R50_23355 [Myxococcota bacterium]|nr:hypothetical protein [Myxococcota bacterium]